MKPGVRRRLSLAAAIAGLCLAAVAAETWLHWGVSFGPLGAAFGYGGMLRIEFGPSHPTPFQFRAHPLEVRGFGRSTPSGVIEIGSVPLLGVAVLLGGAALLIGRTPRSRVGLCPSCWYDIQGLPAGATTCPECGGRLEPQPTSPPIVPPTCTGVVG